LSQEWEWAALEAEKYGARVVLLRFGIVLGREDGALKQMIPVFRKYMGSPLGSGKQWFSWITPAGPDQCLFVFDREAPHFGSGKLHFPPTCPE
jgi:NAD dependent epimerase/dehydratase family enzyme